MSTSSRYSHRNRSRFTLGLACACLSLGAHAQVYRSVGPGGQVTYSDTAPASRTNEPKLAGSSGAGARNPALPYALQQVTQRYPVTLYSSGDCEPCELGRKLLTERGIPFSEKTVQTNADIVALQQLAGTNSLPVLTIGSQQIKGYAESSWTQYLDAAGYPGTSQLPGSWQRAAATPLAPEPATKEAQGPGPKVLAEPAAAAPQPRFAPAPSSTNPAGLRF